MQTVMGQQIQQVEVKIDEDLLKDISEVTGGKYFRATNNKTLANIYEEINTMEKSKIDVTKIERKEEAFFGFALLALLFLVLEFVLKYVYLRTNP